MPVDEAGSVVIVVVVAGGSVAGGAAVGAAVGIGTEHLHRSGGQNGGFAKQLSSHHSPDIPPRKGRHRPGSVGGGVEGVGAAVVGGRGGASFDLILMSAQLMKFS